MKDDWYDDDPDDAEPLTHADQLGVTGRLDQFTSADDVCPVTLTLTADDGLVYTLVCEEDGPHEQHSATVRWMTRPDAFRADVATQVDRLLELNPDGRRAWRMNARAWAVVQEIAPDGVDADPPSFHGLPVHLDEGCGHVDLICDDESWRP